jgi:hypothetical protein
LRHLRENVWRKRLELWHKRNLFLHHDNVPAHMSLKTIGFVTKNKMVIVPNLPYSTDLAPCDFALFPNWKLNWRDNVLKQH